MRTLAAILVTLLTVTGCQQKESTPEPVDTDAAKASLQTEARQDNKQAQMIQVLQLDATQASALNEAYTARDNAATAWIEGEKGDKLVAWEAEIKRAAKAKDLGAVRNATSRAKPLRDEFRQLFATHQANIMNVLTPEQQIHWQGFEVASKLLDLTKDLGLNPQHIAAIEQGGPTVVHQAIQNGEPNPKAAAFLELERWMEDTLLTQQQRAAYDAVKSENKMRSLDI